MKTLEDQSQIREASFQNSAAAFDIVGKCSTNFIATGVSRFGLLPFLLLNGDVLVFRRQIFARDARRL